MKVEVHAEKRVFDDFFRIDEAEVSFERFDGTMSPRVKRLSLERGDSVAAMIYNTERAKLVFVEQFKYPAYRRGAGWLMETMAGIIENGETPEAALRREVLEEVGYRVGRHRPIAAFYVSPGGSTERVFLSYVEVTDADHVSAGGGLASEAEDIRTVELTIAEAARRLEAGEIEDVKALVGIQWLLARPGLIGNGAGP